MQHLSDWFFLGAFAKWRNATISFVICVRPSVCPHVTTRLPLRRIFMKFDIWVFFKKSAEKSQVSLKSDNNNVYFT
jgi:hypothetical protein